MARKTANKRTSKKRAAKKSGSRAETVTFVAGLMKANPEVSMTELKKAGKKAGHNVYPLIIGLARKELGLSKPARKSQGRKSVARKAPAARATGRRGPGRPRKEVSIADALDGLAAQIRALEAENLMLRGVFSEAARVMG